MEYIRNALNSSHNVTAAPTSEANPRALRKDDLVDDEGWLRIDIVECGETVEMRECVLMRREGRRWSKL